MSRPVKMAFTGVILALVATVAGVGTFAYFSATTESTGNTFAAGTVTISDNDAGSAVVSLSSAAPGDASTGCIRVTNTGSMGVQVRLYGTVSGDLAPYLSLTVTRGTDSSPSFNSCAGFTADGTDYIGAGAGVTYSGTLGAYPSTYGSGILDPTSGAPVTWSPGQSVSYRYRAELQNDTAAQGKTATVTFTWEARNS